MESLSFSLVQTSLLWEDKAANLRAIESQLDAVAVLGQVVVLPEMFSTGFSMRPEALAETMEGPTIRWMQDQARQRKIILTGSLMVKEGDAFFNRLLWVLPDGSLGKYDKRHRFAYAGEDQHYAAGNSRVMAAVGGWRIHLQICYDLRFPVWARQQVQHGKPEYDVLLYVANWPERRSHAWKTLLAARAIENQAYVIGVNRTGEDGNGIAHSGDSRVLDPLGNLLWTAESENGIHTETLTKTHLQRVREQFPFWKDGDSFTLHP
ncbi:MAG: amidohydrolase [Sphingobacteriia bacterium]|nr:MAG: amidohydrolase [Sphingobacteriia bacterium]